MPLDVFAALGALVRAEAVRTKKVPAPTPADEATTPRPRTPARPQAEPPTAVPAPVPPARKGLLARMRQKLTTLFG
ncbi:hypothetical protein ACIQU1_18575 [Streptomyces angustmyceticus]|uniref:hypothetical protein n=1 Tax=Streptomyces angustmyceticus TaxID=285578 RepID=UPI00344C9058